MYVVESEPDPIITLVGWLVSAFEGDINENR